LPRIIQVLRTRTSIEVQNSSLEWMPPPHLPIASCSDLVTWSFSSVFLSSSSPRRTGKEGAGGACPGEWGSSKLAREVLENTFRAEFFVPKGSEFPDFCQGWEVTSAQPIQAHPHLGCHDVKKWGMGCLR
jgi:hypothetical protein